MSMVHTARGTGRIVETETVRGRTSHRVVGNSFDYWFPETEVHTAGIEDGWEPIPEDEFPGNPYGEAGPEPMPEEQPMGMDPGLDQGFDGSFTDALQGLTEFSQTGQVGPEALAEFGGSPDEQSILGYRQATSDFAGVGASGDLQMGDVQFPTLDQNGEVYIGPQGVPPMGTKVQSNRYYLGGPGDHVDDDNSVKLPYNPDPQHDAVNAPSPDASWGPGEYDIDADERLHPADSLTFNEVETDEGGPFPGPAPHLFAATEMHQDVPTRDDFLRNQSTNLECDYCGQKGHTWEKHPEAHADVAAWEREKSQLEEPFGKHVEGGIAEFLFDEPGPYEVSDDEDWLAAHDDERLVDREEAEALERERRFHEHTPQGLDRAASYGPAPVLGPKYVTPLLYTAVDHFNDPVQMFRDDPTAFIQRRGSSYSIDDGELDRLSALIDSDKLIRQGSWRDVRAKAKRLRDGGKVTIKDISPDRIYATVQGDNGTYETLITKGSSLGGYDAYNSYGDQHVGNWHCSCKWGNWAFKRRFTFIGRLCSHGLASYWEMQAAHQRQDGRDPRRDRVKTRRATLMPNEEFFVDDNDVADMDDRGLDYLIDHYGPHDKWDREQDFARRTDEAQDYADRTDLPGDADDVPAGWWPDEKGLIAAARRDFQRAIQADFLRTQPRGMTPQLNHIPKERDSQTVSVTSLEDIDMPDASDEGTLPDDAASVEEREAALHLGRRIVGWIADEVLPDFEEWYARNNGRTLDQARPTEASEAAANYAAERGLDQATTEMLQEFINQQFGPEDLHDDPDGEDTEIKHFAMAAGRYLMAATRHLAAPPRNPYQQPGDPQTLPDILGPALNSPSGNGPMPLPNAGGMDRGRLTPGAPGAPQVSEVGLPGGQSGGIDFAGAGGIGAPSGPAGINRTSLPSGGGAPGAPAGVLNGPNANIPWTDNGKGPAPTPVGQRPTAPGGGGGGAAVIDQAAGTTGGGGWAPNNATSPIGAGSYQIQQGDTLSDIAQRSGYGTDYNSLAQQNSIADPNKINAGDSINIGTPAGAEHAGTGAAPGPNPTPQSDTATPTGSDASAPAANDNPGVNGQAPGDLVGGSASTPPPETKTDEPKTSKVNHILASDDSLLNHLRSLAQEPQAGETTGSEAHATDVRKTVDELRDRGYDASQLVAMVRTADAADGTNNYDWADDPANPKNNGVPAGPEKVVTPGNPAPLSTGAPPAAAPAKPPTWGAPATPATPTTPAAATPSATPAASPGGGAGGMLTAQPDASKNPTPSTDAALAGGAPQPGGSQTNKTEKEEAGEAAPASGGTGGMGDDFMQALPSVMDAFGSGMGALSDLGGGGGFGGGLSGLGDLGGLAGGIGDAFSGILGANFASGDDEAPLLGVEPVDVSKAPTESFAGSGPDPQHWMSSSEDYVNEHEMENRHDIDDFDGDILKYSMSDQKILAAILNTDYQPRHQANAFDNYGDWAYAESGGSANPEDWASVETFLNEAEDRAKAPQNLEPARKTIEDHLNYTASLGRQYETMYRMGAGSSPAGFFGVGAEPRLPTADGLSHTPGAPNLKSVTKPKKVKPPHPPNLAPPQLPAPQVTAQPPGLAQPRQPMMQAPQSNGFNALGKPKRTTGGINRQGEQLQAGVITPVFGEMGSSVGFVPEYSAQPPQVFAAQQQQYGMPPPMSPDQHLGGFGWDALPGQDGTPNAVVAQQGPPDTFGSRRFAQHMATMDPQYVAHNQQAAAAMGEYRTPHVGNYERTNDSSEVVRQFQATLGGDWHTGYNPTGPGDADIAAGANMFLSRTAGRNFSLADQARLEQESHVLGARNLDELDLSGTHYLAED